MCHAGGREQVVSDLHTLQRAGDGDFLRECSAAAT